jgi:acyl-CoA dehydrogenase
MEIIPYQEEHIIFRNTFRKFLEKEIVPHVDQWEEEGIVPRWAWKVADRSLQLFGGYGYCEEYPIVRAWRDIRITRILAGSNEIMKQIIAKAITQ